jgi:hypothetical protein
MFGQEKGNGSPVKAPQSRAAEAKRTLKGKQHGEIHEGESYDSYNNQSTGSRPCRVVEINNVNDDDLQEAKPYLPEVPNDFEDRAAELKKFTR